MAQPVKGGPGLVRRHADRWCTAAGAGRTRLGHGSCSCPGPGRRRASRPRRTTTARAHDVSADHRLQRRAQPVPLPAGILAAVAQPPGGDLPPAAPGGVGPAYQPPLLPATARLAAQPVQQQPQPSDALLLASGGAQHELRAGQPPSTSWRPALVAGHRADTGRGETGHEPSHVPAAGPGARPCGRPRYAAANARSPRYRSSGSPARTCGAPRDRSAAGPGGRSVHHSGCRRPAGISPDIST
jgi:hypothetical protein